MSYWILPESRKVISCTTAQRLSLASQSTTECTWRIKDFDSTIEKRLNTKDNDLNEILQQQPKWNRLSLDENDHDFIDEFVKTIDDETVPEGPDDTNKNSEGLVDNYLSMEVGLPREPDDELVRAQVKKRVIDVDGDPVGVAHSNLLLDTRKHEVEFADGTNEIITANTIAENMLSQVDEEGHMQMLLSEIIDHRTNGSEV